MFVGLWHPLWFVWARFLPITTIHIYFALPYLFFPETNLRAFFAGRKPSGYPGWPYSSTHLPVIHGKSEVFELPESITLSTVQSSLVSRLKEIQASLQPPSPQPEEERHSEVEEPGGQVELSDSD